MNEKTNRYLEVLPYRRLVPLTNPGWNNIEMDIVIMRDIFSKATLFILVTICPPNFKIPEAHYQNTQKEESPIL